MTQQTVIGSILQTCGFTVKAHWTYLMTNIGLKYWSVFTMIEFSDFVDIAKSASRHTAPFIVGVLKLKCLKALKF